MTLHPHLYGLANCDQVRKARAWLQSQGVSAIFHDFRRDGLNAAMLTDWMMHLPWDAMINQRSSSWRALTPQARAAIVDQASALEALLACPSLIKRPILVLGPQLILGFSAARYQSLLQSTRM